MKIINIKHHLVNNNYHLIHLILKIEFIYYMNVHIINNNQSVSQYEKYHNDTLYCGHIIDGY